jgi:hypothetical protein
LAELWIAVEHILELDQAQTLPELPSSYYNG